MLVREAIHTIEFCFFIHYEDEQDTFSRENIILNESESMNRAICTAVKGEIQSGGVLLVLCERRVRKCWI